MPKGFVYILKSSKDEKHYTGKHRRDLSIIYYEETPSIAKAVEREKYIKDLGAKRFLGQKI